MKLWNYIFTVTLGVFLAIDALRGEPFVWTLAVDIILLAAVAAITVFRELEGRVQRRLRDMMPTFEQGETETLVNLSKGVEPVPIPGEVLDVETHRLGDRPEDCGICARLKEGL